jgi:hypothetical protein
MGCDAMQSGKSSQMFQRDILPPSSGPTFTATSTQSTGLLAYLMAPMDKDSLCQHVPL